MKQMILMALLTGIFAGEPKINSKNCRTTFVITDCSDKAVSGATVTITTCKPKQTMSKTTDSDGKAVFSICGDDICDSKVTTSVNAGLSKDCTGSKENTICRVKVCDQLDHI